MKTAIFWFRRDLRLEDNKGLHAALLSGKPVQTIFIFDRQILEELPEDDARVTFIYQSLQAIHQNLLSFGSSIRILHGDPLKVWERILATEDVAEVFINRDYEPYAVERDRQIEILLKKQGIALRSYKDQVIFEKDEVLKNDGTPYTVFTPYKRRWIEAMIHNKPSPLDFPSSPSLKPSSHPFPELGEIGFQHSEIQIPPYDLTIAQDYESTRNFPALDATSHLSPHLRFGTVGIRSVLNRLKTENEVFLSELIWREFFMQILSHFPRVVDQNFRRKYDGIQWRNNEMEFSMWCEGLTGYPLVDAGMRQLNSTGFMHNRVRMVCASFLCKHLLVDWRWGEAYFALKLNDYELSSNNGNWQWAAGTGCDAAPYFRIFNPHEQLKKFDKDLKYIQQWVPEYGSPGYNQYIVDHTYARTRALETYKSGIKR